MSYVFCLKSIITDHEYWIKDHLGNVRVIFCDDNDDGMLEGDEVRSQHNYYSFGMEQNGIWQQDALEDIREFRYNGKEELTTMGLDVQNYGARWYDPAIGRFCNVDPLSAEHAHNSPYNYAANDPIGHIDALGLAPVAAIHNLGDPPIGAMIGGAIRAGYEQLRYNIKRNNKIVFGGADPSSIPYRRYGLSQDEWGNLSVSYKEYSEEPSAVARIVDNTLAGMDVASAIPAGTGVHIMMKSPMLFSSDFIKRASAAFQEAIAGGKHSGFLDNVLKTDANLGKSIRKLNRRISEHESYISDPTLKYGDEWAGFSDARKAREIGHWQSEIETFTDQVNILNDLQKAQ